MKNFTVSLAAWLTFVSATAIVFLAFGADLLHPGFALGVFTLICVMWSIAIRMVQKDINNKNE